MISNHIMWAGSLVAAIRAVDGAYVQFRTKQGGQNLYEVEKVINPSTNELDNVPFPYEFEIPSTTMRYENVYFDSQVKDSDKPKGDHYYHQGINKIGEANIHENQHNKKDHHMESTSSVEQNNSPIARIDFQELRNIIPNLTKRFNFGNPGGSIIRQQGPFAPMNVGFAFVILMLIGKVALAVLLASGFVIAGQVLYAFAQATGTTSVFGMESTLTFIYKTLPLVEALLRGDPDIAGREAVSLIEAFFG
ncbi:unnamed protein product [Meganyctiphanes norvegica]|uniref:Uncharacterized protein n=1 Tax=Meganyctiphanes norvegica TaxID=48144 RepID=A0AAV2PLE6_MEGNR